MTTECHWAGVLAGANSHDFPLLAPALELLTSPQPLPEDITVHLDAGYDSAVTLATLAGRGLHGEIAHKGEPAPIQAGRLRRCCATSGSSPARSARRPTS